MSPSVAALACAVGVAGLFYLDRDGRPRSSVALWLPVLWIAILGSRPISVWLGADTGADAVTQLIEGSPLDRFVSQVLLVLGLLALLGRAQPTRKVLVASWPVLAYFAFSLLSIAWSDYPFVAAKRWLKAVGDLVMVLLVVTDPEPKVALKRLLSRTALILLPASLLLIKYFGDLGRGYDPWSGAPVNTGVTTNKNTLGVITLVLSLGALWQVLTLVGTRGAPGRSRRAVAQVTILCFGVAVLALAHSATSGVSFGLGVALMLVTSRRHFQSRPSAVHALIAFTVAVAAVVLLLGGHEHFTRAVGRTSNLTGRTEIWSAVFAAAQNSIVGAGFESFWLGPRLSTLRSALNLAHVLNSAHNGYLEVYLNLGVIGLALMLLVLVTGYRRVIAAFQDDPRLASLQLAYVVGAAVYSMTEAGFRMMSPTWVFFLLAILGTGPTSSVRAEQRAAAAPSASLGPSAGPRMGRRREERSGLVPAAIHAARRPLGPGEPRLTARRPARERRGAKA